MVLIIGGYAAGKRGWVKREMGYPDEKIANGVLDSRPVLDRLQELIRDCLKKGEEPQNLFSQLLEKEAIICDEMGCGVVPVNEEETRLREETGRLCIRLAEQAEQVVRVVCGVPMVIAQKGGGANA